jgi:hypothetical protein
MCGMSAPSPEPTRSVTSTAGSSIVGTAVVAIAFFDAVLLGAPIALLSASLEPPRVFVAATVAVVLLVVGCCTWVDRRWDDWVLGNGGRIEMRLESMRRSRLLRHPVGWIQGGSDRRYALAAAIANPILVAAFARSLTGEPIGERRIMLGAVAYAIPYVAMWSILGFLLGEAVRAV